MDLSLFFGVISDSLSTGNDCVIPPGHVTGIDQSRIDNPSKIERKYDLMLVSFVGH